VLRAVRVLDELARDAPQSVTLAELSRRLGAAKASLSYVLEALVETGFVRRGERGFVLGRRLVELGGAYLVGVDEVSEFASLAQSLPVAARETVQLSTLVGQEVVYLARHDGTQSLRLGTDVGRRFPASCTATGKAILALMDDARVGALYAGYTFPRRTTRSISTLDGLLADLARTRERGFALDDEEANEGIVCLGVAVPAPASGELFGVSVTILKANLDDYLRDLLVTDLQRLAGSIAHPLRSVSRAGQARALGSVF